MGHIFGVNAAVSVVLGCTLILIWMRDKEQRFTLDMGWLLILSSSISVAYLAYRDSTGIWRDVGMYTMGIGATASFMLGAMAVNHLQGNEKTSTRMLITVASVVVVFYAVVVLVLESSQLWITANASLYTVLGLYSIARLWSHGMSERIIGLSFLALGLNALNPLFLGEETGAPLQVAIGTVIRVILCCALIFAALSRSRKKAQQERNRFLQLTEQSQQGMIVMDQQEILYANQAAATLFGYSTSSEFMKAGVYSTVPEESKQKARAVIEDVLQGKITREGWESTQHRRDGEPVYIFLNLWRTEWEGKPAVHLTLTDNTAQVQARRELQRLESEREAERIAFAERVKNNLLAANNELEQKVAERTKDLLAASAAKSQFLANMSHEIRTPMNAVMGMLKLLRATSLSGRQMDYVIKTQGAAQSLLGLLNDILDFSKIDAGKMNLELRPLELDRLFRDLSVILSLAASGKDIQVLYDIAPGVPRWVVADSLRLQQVLLNLCTNAIKFTHSGEVVTRVQLEKIEGNKAHLFFSVQDTGIGISEEHQHHIFEAFSQADATTTRRFGGTGLGLSISRRLIELMGGTLAVKSAPGAGSTFSFDLWMELDRTAEVPPPSEKTAPATEVLIVDGNEVSRSTLGNMARGLGWGVTLASSGEEALEHLEHLNAAGMPLPQAIFSDWKLPEMDGWATLHRVTQRLPADHKPVLVMVTGSGRELLNERSKADQMLLDGYLVKPVTAGMLQEAITEAKAGRSNLREHSRVVPASPKRLDGLKILLVEDNPLNQLVAIELLRNEGALVELAENGMLAVQALENKVDAFDVVLMDMQMPVMDGCTATRLIRKKLKLSLPVIAMTANIMASDRDDCIKAGMNAHVGKPFDVSYLVEVIQQFTGRRGADLPPPATSATTEPPKPHESALRPPPDAVDCALALERIGGDEELFRQICDAYLRDIVTLPASLEDLLQSGEWTAAARLLHTIKGTSSTVGALYLEAVARDGEQQLKTAPEGFNYGAILTEVREGVAHTLVSMQAVMDDMDQNK